jgi:hypothetical protein
VDGRQPAEGLWARLRLRAHDDKLGAIVGPLLALGLVSLFSIHTAILVSVIPGLLAGGGDRLRDPPSQTPQGHRTQKAALPHPTGS